MFSTWCWTTVSWRAGNRRSVWAAVFRDGKTLPPSVWKANLESSPGYGVFFGSFASLFHLKLLLQKFVVFGRSRQSWCWSLSYQWPYQTICVHSYSSILNVSTNSLVCIQYMDYTIWLPKKMGIHGFAGLRTTIRKKRQTYPNIWNHQAKPGRSSIWSLPKSASAEANISKAFSQTKNNSQSLWIQLVSEKVT